MDHETTITNRVRQGVLAPLTGGAKPSAAQKRISARLADGVALRALARELGETPGYLSQVIHGKRPASKRLRRKLAPRPPAWLAQAVANLRALERQANDGR